MRITVNYTIYLHLTKSTLFACRCLFIATFNARTPSFRLSHEHCRAIATNTHTHVCSTYNHNQTQCHITQHCTTLPQNVNNQLYQHNTA